MKNSHHITLSQEVSIAVTPFKLANHMLNVNHQKLLTQFPGIPHDEEQNNKLFSFIAHSFVAKQIIKVSSPFFAVKGTHHFDHDVANLPLLKCQPDFYTAYFSEKIGYQHLQTLDGSELTVVDVNNISLSVIQPTDNAVHKYGMKVGYLSFHHAEVYNRCLFKPDIERFFGMVTSDNQQLYMGKETERSSDNMLSIKSLLNLLQDKTGAESHAQALELGIANADQLQLEEQYQDKSPAYAALKIEIRKAENDGLRAKNITEMTGFFSQYNSLKSRQPVVFAQIIFDVF